MNIILLNKECTKCKTIQPIENFHKYLKSKDGHQAFCKTCIRKIGQTYYQNNKDKITKYYIEYRSNNKDKVQSYSKKWESQNKEKMNKWRKSYSETYRQKYKDQIRERKREWDRKAMLNPLHRLNNNLRGGMYHALKGKKGFRKWEDLVGYTLQDLINHITPLLNNTTMTWENYGSIWHVDHIVPKSWFKYENTDNPKFKECWSLFNLQPKLKIDNIRKGNRFVG